jgi:CPA2 family monovalent cation:H+ antiporter-2
MQPVLAAIVLSMLIAPFLIEYSENMARRFSATEWMNRATQLTNIAAQTMAEEQHVILCGYGRSGQNLARLLEKESVPFIALDLDPIRIHDAAAAGESVVYGDAARYEVLIAAGLMRAKLIVISYTDTTSTLRVLRQVQAIRPELPVVVRTLDDSDIDLLKEAGAAEVVAEIMEGSIMLASHAFMHLGVPLARVLSRMRETREQRYSLFRGFYHGISDEVKDSGEKMQLRLLNVMIVPGSAAVGKKLGELDLGGFLVEVPAVRRRNVRELLPDKETRLEAGDVLVLRGIQENLAAAEIRLLQG